MQAILFNEIILMLPHEFNAETYRVSFEFQVVIRYVYARAPLPFSNSRHTRDVFSLSRKPSPAAFLDGADIQILFFSNFTIRPYVIAVRLSYKFFLPRFYLPFFIRTHLDILISHRCQFRLEKSRERFY